jgi:hypothetical protein
MHLVAKNLSLRCAITYDAVFSLSSLRFAVRRLRSSSLRGLSSVAVSS